MTQPIPANGHYADVNGIRLYYETYGTGQPLVLLHGGFGNTGMFGPVLAALAEGRQVIAVDLQGHGRTADVDRPMRFEAMADDIAGLIEQLGFGLADVMGYSLGGGVALQTAIRHPERVRKLVLVSAPFKRAGWFPEMVAGMTQMGAEWAEAMKPTPMYQTYAAIAPRPDDWLRLVQKTSELLRQDYDWSEHVPGLKMPVLIVAGDADGLSPAHAVEFFKLLGGGLRDANWDGSGQVPSRLAILPSTTHYNIFMSPALAAAVTPFLA